MGYGWRATIYTPRASTPRRCRQYPRKLYKEEKLAKDGGENQQAPEQQSSETTTAATHNKAHNRTKKTEGEKNSTTAVLHWGTQRKLCDPI
ncbi:hypothetical protein ACLKA7_016415 [Drosophila subpalustris]